MVITLADRLTAVIDVRTEARARLLDPATPPEEQAQWRTVVAGADFAAEILRGDLLKTLSQKRDLR